MMIGIEDEDYRHRTIDCITNYIKLMISLG